MPTPSDPTIPVAHSEQISRSSFTSCPPDERDYFTTREPPSDIGDDTIVTRTHHGEPDQTTIARHDTPTPDDGSSSPDMNDLNLTHRKEEQEGSEQAHREDASIAASPEASSDCDSAILQASRPERTQVIYSDHLSMQWRVGYPQDVRRYGLIKEQKPAVTTSFLRPGSKFHGTQRSDRQVYDVQVEIKDVDLAESFLCGYLRIQGLTDDHPTLTTFFEGEIIGPKHLFKTTHASWGSTEKVDLQHWARFPAWRPLAKSAKSPNFTLKNFQQREHLFMRWKEYFLVPDHRVKTITGASFEGFYYICFNQCDGKVSGIYFHAKSEKYQQLELQHVEDHGCMGAVQFR